MKAAKIEFKVLESFYNMTMDIFDELLEDINNLVGNSKVK